MKGLAWIETYLIWLTLNKPFKACYTHEVKIQKNREKEWFRFFLFGKPHFGKFLLFCVCVFSLSLPFYHYVEIKSS